MKRKLYQSLINWKQNKRRKPLLLMGARQVGKTSLLRQFGKTQYKNLVTINFDDQPQHKLIFSQDKSPQRIIRDLSLALNVTIEPGETLLFLDEIQECPEALNALKYFNENANEYHVCGAGSLLGVKLANTQGFPVGKVNFLKLHPLSFFEYLNAIGQDQLADYLISIKLTDSINDAIHLKLIEHLKHYLVIGGMPEAVATYAETNDIKEARTVHQEILSAYDLDFAKHAPSELITKISECFHSIPSQLAKENKKFIYSVIRTGARARSYEAALQWLSEAGLICKVYNINSPKLPLKAYENSNIFKTYLLDVGLLNTMAGLPADVILKGNALFQEFHGSLTENFVAQGLITQHDRLHYWSSGNTAEVDFMITHQDHVLPLEVKSGFTGRKKSLQIYKEKHQPARLMRISPQNLDNQQEFINVPLYLIETLDTLIDSL